MRMLLPERQVRAVFDEETITVYQAYSAAIAVPAVARGTLAGTPFKLGRMTWIKPSFLWMMHRSGWATKAGQEHVLALQITRAGFEWALAHSCLSHFDATTHADQVAWAERMQVDPVRVQWDPERDISLRPLPWRSLQVGLAGQGVQKFVSEWIVHLADATPLVRDIHNLVAADDYAAAAALLPVEQPYPCSDGLAAIIGADRRSPGYRSS